MDIYKRLSFIEQMSELLLKIDNSLVNQKLVSFYGYLSKEISLKNQIHSSGFDWIKRKRCRKCYSIIECKIFKIKNKFLIIKCNNCGIVKKTKIQKPVKTFYEKQLRIKSK
jgi:RNase P subunit RPR2